MGVAILLGLVVFLAVAGLAIYFVTIYNSLVRLRNDIDKAWANIDVLLKQRHDELPKLSRRAAATCSTSRRRSSSSSKPATLTKRPAASRKRPRRTTF